MFCEGHLDFVSGFSLLPWGLSAARNCLLRIVQETLISGFRVLLMVTSLTEMTTLGPLLSTRVHWAPAVSSTVSPGLQKTVTGYDVPSMSDSKVECEGHFLLQVGYVVSANANSSTNPVQIPCLCDRLHGTPARFAVRRFCPNKHTANVYIPNTGPRIKGEVSGFLERINK